jgi:hypothetical protein
LEILKEDKMDLISLLVVLIIVGVVLWLVNSFIPMDPTIRRIITVVVIIFVILWLLSALGFLGNLHSIRIGR